VYIGLYINYSLLLSDFNETGIFLADFRKKYPNIGFHKNPSNGSQIGPCRPTNRWTDSIVKLIVAFFLAVAANLSKNFILKVKLMIST
jgi:hypothetical protein